ncbi:ArsR/SmtB family transcription factor [Anaerocolumna chitinilytica]|uniref:Transcriptional regulator n=1 Tax=Anaerocolumna chitinilytica TaxID=1727145 RepID=A0A7I8DK90_9FIRM|nr:metalloregulator ArsR/SmtB family transcription factor [Anaerocolumna chitinilytica]BCJ97764.1 transcriptional regulator [Anaerocolumna chitinilytica]
MEIESEHVKNARVFKAFCDEKRLGILELLRSGEKCACVLIEQMDIGQSSLSYHMKILCESGIVDSRQEGKWTHYRLSESGSRYAEELLNKLTTPYEEQQPDRCCD